MLWMNLLAGAFYLCGAVGLFRVRSWAPYPLLLALGVLLFVAFICFFHVGQESPFGQRTIGALALRIFVTLVFAISGYLFSRPVNPKVPTC